MRAILSCVIFLAAASCHPDDKGGGGKTRGDAPKMAAAKAEPVPPAPREPRPPLLETGRITISATGKSFWHGAIGNAEEARAILADIRTLPDSSARDRATAAVISSLARKDPPESRALLKEWSEGLVQPWMEAATSIARAMAKSDPAGVPAFILGEVPATLQLEVWGAFLVMIPPAERPGYLENIAEGSGRLRIAADLVAGWLAADPAATAVWLDGFAAGRSADELRTLGEPMRVPRQDRAGPDAWLAAYRAASGAEARVFLAGQAWKYAEEDQRDELAGELAETLPDLAERVRANAILQDPSGYAAKLSADEIAGLAGKDASDLITRWAQRDPREAFNWALENGRPEAAEALSQLYFQEPKEAIAKVSTLKAGKERDSVLQTICAMETREGNMAVAEALLPLISDPTFREGVRQAMERNVRTQDPGTKNPGR